MSNRRQTRSLAGFTMGETLIVVAILVILMGLATPAVLTVRRDLKLTELDAAARSIYVAAQNQLTSLKSAGALEGLGGASISKKPQDFPASLPWQEDTYFTLSHTPGDPDPAGLDLLLPQNSIESHLWENHFLVEYNRDTGQVYGVFYGEVPFAYSQIQDLPSRTRADLKTLPVGYYGGSDIVVPDLDAMDPGQITVRNDEILAVHIIPATVTDPGAIPAEYDVTVTGKTSGEEAAFTDITKSTVNVSSDGSGGYYVILDQLENGLHFQDISTRGGKQFIPGEDLDLTVTAKSADESKTALPKTVRLMTNSLFSSRSGDSVEIAYGRHLQNLEEGVSGLDANLPDGGAPVANAVQVASIDWSYYKDVPFRPITNPALVSYNGQSNPIQSLRIAQTSKDTNEMAYAGLFGLFTGESLANVTLVNATLEAGDAVQAAGLLAGEVRKARISDCLVYAEAPGSEEGRFEQVSYLIKSGKGAAGGLVGKMTGELLGCAASVPLISAGNATAGGLAGSFAGMAQTSYANTGALTGKIVGGFAGEADSGSTFQNCYALGLLQVERDESGSPTQKDTLLAGFCPSKADYSACYSAATYEETQTGAIGFAPAGIHPKNCFYLSANGQQWGKSSGQVTHTLETILQNLDPKIWYRAAATSTHPYYYGSGLSYPYPILKANHHYGDWPVLAGDAMLVYYERYSDGSYGMDNGLTIRTLQNKLAIQEDGYALLVAREGGITVTFDGNSVATRYIPGQTVSIQEKTYQLQLLTDSSSFSMYTAAPGDSFYHSVVYNGDTTFFCNPHFAKTALNGQTEAPQGYDGYTAMVRTPRHLYNLGHNSAYWSLRLEQERNLDCGADYPYTDSSRYAPTGSQELPFTGQYLGYQHTISRFATQGDAVGLFGHVSSASLSGIYLEDPSISGIRLAAALAASASNTNIADCRAYLTGRVDDFNGKDDYASVEAAAAAGQAGGLIGQASGCTMTQSFAALKIRSAGEAGGFAGSLAGGDVSTCYASGTVMGSGITGGFVGRASVPTIRDSYSAADVEGGPGSGGFVGKSEGAILANCYACGMVSLPKEAPDTVGAFYGLHSGLPPAHCRYMVQTGHNDGLTRPQGLVGAVAYSALQYTGGLAESHPYAGSLQGSQYPFTPAGSLPHFGNWPLERDKYSATLVYYEKYAQTDDSGRITGYEYGFYAGTSLTGATTWALDTLQDRSCVEDGYAVLSEYELKSFDYKLVFNSSGNLTKTGSIAVSQEDEKETAQVLLSGQTVSFMSGDFVKYVVRNAYIYRLPFDLQEVSRDAASSFYVKLVLSGAKRNGEAAFENNEFYYCPHFARTAVNPVLGKTAAEEPAQNPETVYIRSARQLNALGRYNYYWNNVSNQGWTPYTFYQETDLNFSTYTDWYCGEKFTMSIGGTYANRPIGYPITGSASGQKYSNFQCTYDGQGHKIIDYSLRSNEQFVGMFGEMAGATLKNMVLCASTAGKAEIISMYQGDAQAGIGVLAGLVYSSTDNITELETRILNCSVSGYTIRLDSAKLANSQADSCMVAIGGIAGFNLGYIDSCTAVNEVRCPQVNRHRAVGGLVGNNSGSVTNSYAGGSITSLASKSQYPTYAGGLIGVNGDFIYGATGSKIQGSTLVRNNPRQIQNCYTYVTMTPTKSGAQLGGAGNLGKVNKLNPDFKFANCYYLEREGDAFSDQNAHNGTAYSYSQMADASFSATLNSALFRAVTPGCSYHSLGLDPAGEDYPFPAVVTRSVPVLDENGQVTGKLEKQYVHYGDWPEGVVEPDAPPVSTDEPEGEFGVFRLYRYRKNDWPYREYFYAGDGYLVDSTGAVTGTPQPQGDPWLGEDFLLIDGIPSEDLGKWEYSMKTYTANYQYYLSELSFVLPSAAGIPLENVDGSYLCHRFSAASDPVSVTLTYYGDDGRTHYFVFACSNGKFLPESFSHFVSGGDGP